MSSSRLFSSLIRTKSVPYSTTIRTFRTMASGAVTIPPGKYEFLVVVHDKPGMLEKRLEVRGQHFDNMKPNVESGNWKMGGAILNSVPKDDSPSSLDFAGSTLVCIADSVEQVRENLSKDIYATSGVWDMDKVQIYPFKAAFRFN
ncbi:hypothetical protein HYE67_011153 [Fusarium culmorum]|uniref:YCII-related domain-containing protein n=1 Tax=Fusarium culmorum TaxID=5516 RepID=A0A2T4GGP3_FUSCU|nr:hypothetical protein FCULG_00009324 [Fusarium culmorum]QPC68922.1 hypothetical protein HYE67_011153 [Fusarium culmorum]